MRANANDSDSQTVLEAVNGIGSNWKTTICVAYVGTKAYGIQIIEIGFQFLNPIIEVMIAESYILVAG